MADHGGYKHRCGYCGTPGDPGRCPRCGSGMDDEARAIEGARRPELIKTWLRSRDRGWEVADGMRAELYLRRLEDFSDKRDPKRFDGVPDPLDSFGDEI